MIYPAISIRQPWAALILLGLKDVENRSWPLPDAYVGVPILLHSSKAPRFDPQSINREAHRRGMSILPCDARHVARTGCILGAIVFGDCQGNFGAPYSRWCDEDALYWWRIQAVTRLAQPIPAPGHLRFWTFDLV